MMYDQMCLYFLLTKLIDTTHCTEKLLFCISLLYLSLYKLEKHILLVNWQ